MSSPISDKKDYTNFKNPENNLAEGKTQARDVRSLKTSTKDIITSKSDKQKLIEKKANEIKELKESINAKELKKINEEIASKEKKLQESINAKEIKNLKTKINAKVIEENAKEIERLKSKIASKNDTPGLSIVDSKFIKATASEVKEIKSQMVNVNKKYRDDETFEVMKNFNLIPDNKLKVGNATYYCSIPFTHKDKIMTVGLVKVDEKVYPRLFCLSDSQGLWRVVPFGDKRDDKISYFGKGLIESDTQLPFELHFALVDLQPKEKLLEEKGINPVFVNTGRNLNDIYTESTKYEDHFNIVGDEDLFELQARGKKRTPETIQLPSSAKCPDYKSKKMAIKSLNLPLYGDIKAIIVPSRDENFNYLFYQAKDKRVFLAGVQSNKPDINIFGVHETAFNLEEADAPLLEYKKQIDPRYAWGNSTYEYSGEHYRNNWNYVKNLPIIKDYYAKLGISIPDSV